MFSRPTVSQAVGRAVCNPPIRAVASATMAPPKQQIRTSTPRPVFDTRFKLGESPIWDTDTQRLLWVDQEGKRIHWFYPADGRQGSVPTQELTPAIILTQQSPDILVVPMEQNVYAIDLSKNGEVRSVLATVPEEHGSQDRQHGLWRFNDSRAAPGGQIIAGRMTEHCWQKGVGGWVYKLQQTEGAAKPELSVLFEQGKMGLPNGMCWNMDKREMYYSDTYAGKVYAMPCAADGTPDTSASWRTIVTLDSDTQGAPDGMAIDTEHRLWVAHESGGQVGCYDSATGELLHKFELPVQRPSAVAFGGADLRQLYIATISEEGDDASPDSGKLFVVDVEGAQGAGGAHKYSGPV